MSKILCVTGASSEVGACLIDTVAGNYDSIICHYRNSKGIIEELQRKHGNKIVPVAADFSDEIDTREFVGFILSKNLSPEHFVHLPAVSDSLFKKYSKTDWKQFETDIAVSFRSAVICTQAFLPLMSKARQGKVIFMLSGNVVWEPVIPYSSVYTCTKYALFGLMKSLASEYSSKGVTVNAVSPAVIDTKFLKLPDIVKEAEIAKSPIKRLLTPEDVVPAFEFLLSQGADTITGQNFPVTAGR